MSAFFENIVYAITILAEALIIGTYVEYVFSRRTTKLIAVAVFTVGYVVISFIV